jgi:hypothetical protein
MITWGLPIPGYMCYLNLWWNCLYISLCIYVYILVGGNIWVRQWEGWHPIYEMEKKWNHQPDSVRDWTRKWSWVMICF